MACVEAWGCALTTSVALSDLLICNYYNYFKLLMSYSVRTGKFCTSVFVGNRPVKTVQVALLPQPPLPPNAEENCWTSSPIWWKEIAPIWPLWKRWTMASPISCLTWRTRLFLLNIIAITPDGPTKIMVGLGYYLTLITEILHEKTTDAMVYAV